MASAAPFVKFDDGSEGFASNCFPVRGIQREGSDVAGAWLIAQRAEQRRRFKAVLCAKPRTYARIKQERKKADKRGGTLADQSFADSEDEHEEPPLLDGFFLMKHCCVEDPIDLCSVNIAGKELTECKEEDFQLFDNVAYVNAGENYLPFEAYRGFPIIRELEVPLNAIRTIKLTPMDYPHLEMVDLSFNNLSQEDVLTLGMLKKLKVLHLTGNGFHTLPPDLAIPYIDPVSKNQVPRFRSLEILMLDDNRLSDVKIFASLAGLKRLRHLNLEKNHLFYVPQLKSIEGTMIVNDDEKSTEKLRRSAKKSARKSARAVKNAENSKKSDILMIDSSKNVEAEITDLSKVKSEVESIATSGGPPMLVPANTEIMKSSTMDGGESSRKDSDLLDMDFPTSMGDLSSRIKDLDLPDSSRKQEHNLLSRDQPALETVMEEKPGVSVPPFPELRYVNLAYNEIEEEEALLAVAAWPMLMELVIHHNPLTTERSGDPPLLARFLHDRLGINLIRKKQQNNGLVKPKVEVLPKQSRHVTTIVPKIPKLPLNELLMLEGPKPPTKPKPPTSQVINGLDLHRKPLSPITSMSGATRPLSASDQPRAPTNTTAEDQTQRSRTNAWEEQQQKPPPRTDSGSAFFMTQVDDQEEEQKMKVKSEKKPKKKKKEKLTDKYKGYEILLDYEDDPDYEPPKDMQGNIRALKYALNHELVYRDTAARLDKVQKPVEPYKKWRMPEGGTRKTKQERVDDALTNLKNRTTVTEANLKEVITSEKRRNKSQVAEAQKLLDEIQRRYNAVRVNSMKEAREVKNLVAGIKSEANKHKETAATS